MNRSRSLLLFLVLGAVALGSQAVFRPVAEAQSMTQAAPNPAPVLRFEQWFNPTTGETVKLRFDGQKTTLERGGKVQTVNVKPFDEAAARAQMEENQRSQAEWTVFNVSHFQDMLVRGYGSVEEAKKHFLSLGFPEKLWDDIRIFQQKAGLPTAESMTNTVPAAYSSSLVVLGNGEIPPVSLPGATVIRQDDPAFADSLLFHPTPELTRLYAKLNSTPIEIATPTPQAQAESDLWEQSQELATQGFIRVSPRRPDGSLWLPPALEPHRAELLKLERPVVRPFIKPGKPALWDSKFGGTPYRPNGAAWPVGRSGKPLYFLAQIDLGQANKTGVIKDLPREGLLQFFLAQPDASYAEAQQHPEWASPQVKVLYWPEITRDTVRLSRQIPPFDDEDQREMFNPPERLMGFVQDSEIPSTLDALLAFAEPKNAHTGVGEDYQQAENNSRLQPNGHRLRGYPMVINAFFPPQEDWKLLFQFDGDDYGEQLFGGSSLGGWLGFFIRGSDLKKLDFSRVRLEMDAF